MYYRIKNRLDAKHLLAEIRLTGGNVAVGDRILELAGILDDAYGERRKSSDMGGYILYFPDIKTYEDTVVDLWDYYNIEPREFEYVEEIGENQNSDIQWAEKLFLLSSDDSLVFIYPCSRESKKA